MADAGRGTRDQSQWHGATVHEFSYDERAGMRPRLRILP
jgi:hypothetical protein